MIELLGDGDRIIAVGITILDAERLRIGVLYLEANIRSPITLGEFVVHLPANLTMQPVPRVAVEMEFIYES